MPHVTCLGGVNILSKFLGTLPGHDLFDSQGRSCTIILFGGPTLVLFDLFSFFLCQFSRYIGGNTCNEVFFNY